MTEVREQKHWNSEWGMRNFGRQRREAFEFGMWNAEFGNIDGRRQRTDDRRQRIEDRSQMAENSLDHGRTRIITETPQTLIIAECIPTFFGMQSD